MLHKGGCHCGRVRFEFEADESPEVVRCNCSMCTKSGLLHLIIPRAAFTLLTPWDELANYTFGTGVAQHYFCATCGIRSFYLPRSNPDGVSINYLCVDEGTLKGVVVDEFDGQNWEENAASLAHLSRE